MTDELPRLRGAPYRVETAPEDSPELRAAAVRLFPDLALAERYAGFLRAEGTDWGLLGPREGDRLWSRHLLNCAAPLALLPDSDTVCDVGSGAGLPGLVWAIARPDLHVVLIESLERRARFLRAAVAELGLTSVEVRCARAEDVQDVSVHTVTARAVAPLPRLVGWTRHLLPPTGRWLVLRGERAAQEVDEARADLQRHGLAARVLQTGDAGATATVVEMFHVKRR